MNPVWLFALPLALGGCAERRASVTDAEALFARHREAYQDIAGRVIDAPPDSAQGYDRRNQVFEGIDALPPFESVNIWDEDGARSVRIGLYSYGMAVSGRIVGLAYYADGDPADEAESWTRYTEDCDTLDAAFEAGERIRVGYCRLAENWYAFRYSF